MFNDRSHLTVVLVSLLGSLTATACDNDEPDAIDIDKDAVLEASRDYQSSLAVANPTPILGAHGALMRVYLEPAHIDEYLAIDPANPSPLEFAEGTLIVKEHLDADLVPFETTVMFKGPTGYNPDAGDWWYAKLDAGGELIQGGKDLVTCVDCHSTAGVTDWVYGLPE